MANDAKSVIEEPIPKELFEILACTICKSDLEYAKDKKSLVCSECGARFPIENRVPIMVPKNRELKRK